MRGSFICRLLWFCVCFFVVLGFAPGARAHAAEAGVMPLASFDCAHAPGVDEKLICSDVLLRQADHDLGQAYIAARNANPGASYRASLRTDEHSWILQRNTECQITKYAVVNDGNRPGYVDCMLDEYAERIDDLRQMRRRPHTAPGVISHPIRRSFMAGAGVAGGTSSQVFSSLQLPADSTGTPLLAWRNDGTVGLLDVGAGGAGTLSIWSGGALHTLAQIPQAAQFGQLCALADGSFLLLPASGGTPGWIGADGKSRDASVENLPAQAGQICGIGGVGLELGDGNGAVLHYGMAKQGTAPAPRFVTVTSAAGTVAAAPAIRIDSRFALGASYLPFMDAFLLNRNVNPATLEAAVERHWAKSNCAPYWTVDAKTGAAQQGCIPFGPYVNIVLTALPTRGGTYLAAGGYGLFRISAGAAQLVMPGNISQPAISPDGCSLAFILAQSTSAMVVLDACKTNATSAATGTP